MSASFERQGEWRSASFCSNHRLRCYSGRQWQADTHSSTGCPPTLPRMSPLPLSPSPYSLIIFSLCCISTGPHSSITLHLFFPCWDPFQLPPSSHPPICLSSPPPPLPLLLTQSSDCTALHLHSSGGSWSCKHACPGSCCGCCALYSHWAPCQTGMAARIRSASGTVVGVFRKRNHTEKMTEECSLA